MQANDALLIRKLEQHAGALEAAARVPASGKATVGGEYPANALELLDRADRLKLLVYLLRTAKAL